MRQASTDVDIDGSAYTLGKVISLSLCSTVKRYSCHEQIISELRVVTCHNGVDHTVFVTCLPPDTSERAPP